MKLSLAVSFTGVDSVGIPSNVDLDLVMRLKTESSSEYRLD